MLPHRASAIVLALLAPALAGCIDALEPASVADDVAGGALHTARGWSSPTSPALYGVLDGVKSFVESFDGTPLAVGVFLPDVAGCDWSAETLADACPRLPVVMDAGPYYGTGVAAEKFRPPISEWLVPRGYAVVQMSLRGTGESGGCLEFKNPADVEDVSAVVDWLASQAWSNGNVGMMGRSYDGTSAWAGAASGNPNLKTIVPISGAVDGPGLYYRNGTSEFRGLVNGATYFPTYATDAKPPAEWTERLCQGALVDAHRESAYAASTGDASSDYWQARNLAPRILESYRGSVWLIHGMEDWNVNPSNTAHLIGPMQEAGIEVRAWLGQWAHAYPDRVDEHRNVRWDWADQTVAWFDHYLKGHGEAPWLGVEVEDSLYTWRKESSWPPADVQWLHLEASRDGSLAEPGDAAGGAFTFLGPGTSVVFTSAPLEDDLRIAGFPRFHVTMTPTTTVGGYVFAEIYDVFPDGRSMRIAWGGIDLRHHAGGNGEPATLVPGEPVLALMEMEPADAHVGVGHKLRLVVHRDGVEDVIESPSRELVTMTVGDGASVLKLPTVAREDALAAYAPPRIADA